MGTRAGTDRRQSLRAPVHGSVIFAGTIAPMENLSLGGALVRARPPKRKVALELELRMPNARAFVCGTVVRTLRDQRLALRFDHLSADAEDAIEDEIVSALDAARLRRVLVVDDVEDRRLDIADALRDRAMTPVTPRTPLEVVDAMSGGPPIDVCVVGSRFAGLPGAELGNFLHDTYPWLKILAIGNDATALADDVAATFDDHAW